MHSVIVVDELRLHTVPRCASTAVSTSISGTVERATPDDPADGFRIMVVRHPLDRLVSAWWGVDRVLSNKSWDTFTGEALANPAANPHTRPQVDFVGRRAIDLLVPLERLDEAWENLHSRFPRVRKLQKVNRTDRKSPWELEYTVELAEVAARVYADDLELYERAVNEWP